jgi:hypothetical protein
MGADKTLKLAAQLQNVDVLLVQKNGVSRNQSIFRNFQLDSHDGWPLVTRTGATAQQLRILIQQ